MKKWIIILIIVAVLVAGAVYWYGKGSSEEKELTEAELIEKALELYNQAKDEGMVFSSQCLGSVDGYAIDVVHVPRIEEDNLAENQCEDYREEKVKHFIELDKDGNVFRIV